MTDASSLSLDVLPFGPGLWSELEPIWKSVAAHVPRRSVFMSEPWVGSWLEVFGPQLKPKALVWRDAEGAPVGCTLSSVVREPSGPVTLNRLYLNTTGERKVGTEHTEILSVPRWREAVLSDLVAHAHQEAPDELVLSGFKAHAAEGLAKHWPGERVKGYVSESPYVCLDSVREASGDYLSLLSSNTRSNIRRSFRAYEGEFGDAQLDVAAPDQMGPWFEEMVLLHEERWQERGEAGAFADARQRAFYERLMTRCGTEWSADRPRIDLLRIRFGEETVGLLMNFVMGGTVSFYQSGLRYHTQSNRFKPGFVAHVLAVRHYVESGLSEYDFLGGEPAAVQYKRSLATASRDLVWYRLPSANVKMRALEWAGRWRQTVKRLLGR